MNLREALEIIADTSRQYYEVLTIPNTLFDEMTEKDLVGCYDDGVWGLTGKGANFLYNAEG